MFANITVSIIEYTRFTVFTIKTNVENKSTILKSDKMLHDVVSSTALHFL